MTLPSAPSSISFNDISLELFCSITSYNLNDGYGRCITCLPTPCSTISLSNFYGKTAPLSTLATCACGGWYMGCTTACGTNYYLIVAPATPGFQYDFPRTGCPQVCQNLPVFSPGPIGCNPVASSDGYCVTKFIQSCPNYTPVPVAAPLGYTYPLFGKINALTINGYSDWYIPAATEINTIFCNMDYSWKCGGPMKTSGNQFPTTISTAIPAPAAGSPGCWPYLGYTSGCIAPGASGFGTGWNCNNGGWPAAGSTQFQQYPGCTGVTTSYYAATTQASGQPCGLMPTSCGQLFINIAPRFLCVGNAPCGQGGGWPQPPAWCSGQRCGVYMTRAVRRVAI
jgi:hypothetical protein